MLNSYGPPEGLQLTEIEQPAVDADGVLVKVRAASVNPLDWHLMRGLPYFVRLTSGVRKPKSSRFGVDVAGRVEAVGENVTQFRAGDDVLGGCDGAFAEYVRGAEKNFVAKPAAITFEQAAAIPIAGCTALQGLRDRGHLQSGQRALVNGAAGGVGTFAVQIARVLGAEVTGVCSTSNVELVRSLGAGNVVDYTTEDFTRSGLRYDLILDLVGNHSLRDLRRALAPEGTLVLAGGGSGRWLGPLAGPTKAVIVSRFVGQRLLPFLAKLRKDDLAYLAELVEAGQVSPVLGREYSLAETPDAVRYVETGHARGKVVITL